jgi:hypothetical protein
MAAGIAVTGAAGMMAGRCGRDGYRAFRNQPLGAVGANPAAIYRGVLVSFLSPAGRLIPVCVMGRARSKC